MILLDEHADTLPVGLSGTPFETVYKALRSVAATVWSVDPTVYRAGMAWGFYAQHDPQALESFRAVVAAALVSAQAPLVKDMQTVAELVEYLRLWREYLPTFPALSAIFRLFGAVVDVLPVTDAESQAILPAPDRRGVFYLRIEVSDMQRLLTLDEAVRLALNATPLGSHPLAYLSLESPISAGVAVCSDAATTFVENGAICEATSKTRICGVLTATSDEVVEVDTPERLDLGTISFTCELRDNVMPSSGRVNNGTISFTGELRENVIPGSGTAEEYAPHIIVLLGLKYRSGAFSLEHFNYTGSNNYWWSGFVDADNKQAALDFGCSAISNVSNPCPLQNLVYQPDTFNYEILGLYSDIDGTIPVTEFDLIDFSVTGSGTAEIFCSKQYSSSITAMTWRCKITKK